MQNKKVKLPRMTKEYKKVVTKSKAGVKYIHYKAVLNGTPRVGPNRKGRRMIERFMRLKCLNLNCMSRNKISGYCLKHSYA